MAQNTPNGGLLTLYYSGFGIFGFRQFVWKPKPSLMQHYYCTTLHTHKTRTLQLERTAASSTQFIPAKTLFIR
jgi:hypothetical protein